jgi:hypothetical protein
MSPFIQQCLSRSVLKTLVKGNLGLDYNKALGNVTELFRSAVGPSASEVQIPLPKAEKPRVVRPDELTDVEVEQAILPLFDYFDANLQTLNTYLSEDAKEMVMGRIWKEVLTVIEGLLVPPLSDISSDMKPLSDKEVDVVFKWLKVRLIHCLQAFPHCFASSCGIISMQAGKVLYPSRFCRIRNTGISSPYGSITIGQRTWYISISRHDNTECLVGMR